jgi:N-acetylmuramoyl-L-alanine amidase
MMTQVSSAPARPRLTRQLPLVLLAVTVLVVLAGGILHLAGAGSAGDVAWLTAGALGAAYALAEMAVSLRHRQGGVDVIALLALVGAMAVGELLAAAVVSVMLATAADSTYAGIVRLVAEAEQSPVRDSVNKKIVASSVRFGRDLRSAMRKHTAMPVSDYYGTDGFAYRDDLAGLNLATQPKVLIESGNMRNARDARLLTSTRFQQAEAKALEAAMITFLGR